MPAFDLSAAQVADLAAFHKKEPLKEGLPREELRTRLFKRLHPDVFKFLLADLVRAGGIRMEKDRVAAVRALHRVVSRA